MKLEAKVAIVTGAGAGLGRAISLRLAREGAKVMVADINGAYGSGETTVKMIRDAGGDAVFCLTDVSKDTDAQKLVNSTIQGYGKLDILVNNAGIWLNKPLVEVSEQEWDRMMGVNLKGVFLCSKYAIPHMKARGGVIINVSSRGGLIGAAMATAYCASKGGVVLLTKAMSLELKPFNIRVNALCPLFIDTDMGRQVLKDRGVSGLPPMQAMKPEEVADAALFLASDESSTITGHPLVVGESGNI